MSEIPAVEYVTIQKSVYDSLKDDSWWRTCMEDYGVDNWICYEGAIRMYYREDSEDD